MKLVVGVMVALLAAGFAATTRVQKVVIPDPGLDAAIRAALQSPPWH